MIVIDLRTCPGFNFLIQCFLMEAGKKSTQVLQIKCPCCHSHLWIDILTSTVIKSEKGKKEKESLDILLQKEKKKKMEFDRKFEATSQMQEARRKKAQEIFKKALAGVDEKD